MRTKKYIARPKKLSAGALSKPNAKHDKDFYKWAYDQAKHLKDGKYENLDVKNLIEEIEDLGKGEKRELTNHLVNLLMHMLKCKFQPGKYSKSWEYSIKAAHHQAEKILEENPSLKPQLKDIFEEAYITARLKALAETGIKEEDVPEENIWNIKDIFPNLEKKYC